MSLYISVKNKYERDGTTRVREILQVVGLPGLFMTSNQWLQGRQYVNQLRTQRLGIGGNSKE